MHAFNQAESLGRDSVEPMKADGSAITVGERHGLPFWTTSGRLPMSFRKCVFAP